MAIFTESILFWILLSLSVFGLGLCIYQGQRKHKTLLVFGGIAIAVLILGCWLVFVLDTDRKAIFQTIEKIRVAVEANDRDEVLKYVVPEAAKLREQGKQLFEQVLIRKANVVNIQLEPINYFTANPYVRATFRGTVFGKSREYEDTEFSMSAEFREVEFELRDGQWMVTDNCRFTIRGYRGLELDSN